MVVILFEWDGANVDHIARHSVTSGEAEEAINGATLEIGIFETDDEVRFEELGITERGRVLFLVSVLRENRLRVVTAYEASRTQRIEYLTFHKALHE